MSGNRCGHDKDAPQFDAAAAVPRGKGGLPALIGQTIDAVLGFYASPSLLPELNFANMKDSQMRSERREACVRFLVALISVMDIRTLRVNYRKPGVYRDFTVTELGAMAGLSESRAWNAWGDLLASGFVWHNGQPIEKSKRTGRHKGKPTAKRVSKKLWARLGKSLFLSRQQETHHENHKKREAKAAPGILETLSKSAQRASRKRTKPVIPPPPPNKPNDPGGGSGPLRAARDLAMKFALDAVKR